MRLQTQVTMAMRELDRLKVIQGIVDRELRATERHQIVLTKETVRRIQIAAGLWIPRKLRPPKIQQPRTRRACVGELIQIDGCEHHWFEDRAPMCTALVFVDDATSRLMGVKFTGNGSTFAYISGKFVVIWRRQHGRWRLLHDMFSTNLPLPLG